MKEKEKIKQARADERYKTRMAKLMDKYGLRDINEWVCEHQNTLTRLSYEIYLEEERRAAIMKTVGWFFLTLSIICAIISFFIPGIMFCMIVTLVVGCDMLTNNRIDNLEQRRWRDMVYSMYRLEKEKKEKKEEKKDAKKHSKV